MRDDCPVIPANLPDVELDLDDDPTREEPTDGGEEEAGTELPDPAA